MGASGWGLKHRKHISGSDGINTVRALMIWVSEIYLYVQHSLPCSWGFCSTLIPLITLKTAPGFESRESHCSSQAGHEW
jgi:hypothetical protein